MKKRIAIPVSMSKTQYYLNKAYIDYLVESGFVPVALYPGHDVKEMANECDGLLLPGGIDLDPIYYGYDNDSSFSVDPEKDEFERAVLKAFLDKKKPIMGICRGFQLIVREYMAKHDHLAADGIMEFVEHINEHAQTTDQQLKRNIPVHWVSYIERSLYQSGKSVVQDTPVNSMHHQCLVTDFGVEETPEGPKAIISYDDFHMVAWTDRGLKPVKGHPSRVVCEAVVITGWPSAVMAVQWHPEELRDKDLIQKFFNRHCSRPKAKKAGK